MKKIIAGVASSENRYTNINIQRAFWNVEWVSYYRAGPVLQYTIIAEQKVLIVPKLSSGL